MTTTNRNIPNIYQKNIINITGRNDYDNKMRLAKFHQCLHIPFYTRLYGSALNIDGSRPEVMGKETAKYPGRCTKRRMSTINASTRK